MTVAELVMLLAQYPVTYEVVFADAGRLAMVTHGAAEDKRRVVVLYVEAPAAPTEPTP